MRSDQTFSIDFVARKCKADKSRSEIFARITVNGEVRELSLKEQIPTGGWDNRAEVVKGRTIEVKKINDHIDETRAALRDKYRELESRVDLITASSVKNAYLGKQTSLRGRTLKELLDYFTLIWEPKLAEGGFKNYRTTIAYAELFLNQKFPAKSVYLSQVNGEFVTEYEHFIRTKPIKEFDPCKGNGVGKHIQRLKRILNWAKKELKWIQINQIADYSCPIKKSKRKKLDFQQLVTLEEKVFHDPAISYVKELYVCSSYTGLAFAEIMKLTETDFQWDVDGIVWCTCYRKKSGELCAVPLLKAPSAILRKYREDAIAKGRATIFPQLTNQYANRILKVIQAACEIPVVLTYHVARHTFATTVALKNGIPLETVQMMLGHSKITTTQVYAKVDEEKILGDMAGLDEKLADKKIMALSPPNVKHIQATE